MSENSALQTMLKRMLKPLVRLLLQRGITYIALLEALKSLYIEVACESAKLEEKRLTDSRISLLTGVHRKEVKRLREELADSPEKSLAELKASLSAAVMAKWLSDPDYLDAKQQPKTLKKTGHQDSFEALVYSISKDKHFRSLLDDWLEQKVIQVENDQITLLQHGFVPSEDEEEKLFFAGKNLGAHLEVVANNLQKTDDWQPMFDRAVFYQNLPAGAVAEIEAEAKRRNLETLQAINTLAAKAKHEYMNAQNTPSSAATEATPLHNFHLGCYFHKDSKSTGEQS